MSNVVKTRDGFSRGFTLIELLTTTAIIGLLASIGTVGYNYVRIKARDTKRVADIKTIRSSIETYFEQNSKYPSAPNGIVLGSDEAKVISDAGITPFGGQKGLVYLLGVPPNILPGGVPYTYRSTYDDGSPCPENCPHYEVDFTLESGAGEYLPGDHRLSDQGIAGPETGQFALARPGLSAYLPSSADLKAALGSASEISDLARAQADRPEIQTVNQAVVAPVSTVAAAANLAATAAATVPAMNLGQFAVFLISQPFLLLGRRKRRSWGTVYDSARKTPVDLATVRLIDSRTNRPVATKVTDKNGRYAFTARAGIYRLEVVKQGYVSPSIAMIGVKDDGHFNDIYLGTLLRIDQNGQTVTVNIPVDPEKEPASEVRVLLSLENKKAIRRWLAKSGPFLSAVALVVTPSYLMLGLFALQVAMYYAFKRLAQPRAPKNQGIVYDAATREPVPGAVVRIFSLPYHKVLESRLTDPRGRYNFYVGHGKYYLTVLKPGYQKTETDPIDFSNITEPTFIAADLPMKEAKGNS